MADSLDAGKTPQHLARRPTWRRLGVDAAIVALFMILAVACYWNAWSKGLSTMAQPAADIFDSMWCLTWLPHSVAHGHNPFFSDFANYPPGINVLANTSVLALGLIGSPITLLAGPVAAYNVLITLALGGSATAAYFVIQRFVPWRPAAAIGGLVYGFSPFEIGEGLGHLNLAFAVLPPLILLLLYDLAVRQRGNPYLRGLLLAALVVFQFFVSPEVLVSSVIMGIILIALITWEGRRSVRAHLDHFARGLATAGVVSVAVLAYPAWFFARGPQHINGPIQSVGDRKSVV